MNEFKRLYEAGSVKRWHTVNTIKEQDLAGHSWGVAMIVLHCGGSLRAIEAALVHDLHESSIGDIPFGAKRENYALDNIEKDCQDNFCDYHGIENEEMLDAPERALVKWADMFECLLWAKRDRALGNLGMDVVLERLEDAFSTRPFPNHLAKELYDAEFNR